MELHDFPEYRRELAKNGREISALAPEVYAGFRQMGVGALAEGALSAKQKELMALAISIAVRCDGCIAAHVNGALRQGASEQEFAETIAVAILMGGGPSTVYGAHAWAALQQFKERAQSSPTDTVEVVKVAPQ